MATSRDSSLVFTTMGVAAVLFAVLFFRGGEHIQPSVLTGKTAPDIRFELAGRKTSLAESRGKPILINFWAAWCSPCMEEMPSLRNLEKTYAPRGLTVLAFNIEDEPDSTPGTLSHSGLPTNLIFNYTRDSLAAYRVNAIPESILIDKNGIVRRVYRGPVDWMEAGILKEIEAFL